MPERVLNPEDQTICYLLVQIAEALVDLNEEVRVELLEETEGMTLRLYVADSDLGKVIGKQGRTARSIRTIISAASMKYTRRYALDIADAQHGRPSG